MRLKSIKLAGFKSFVDPTSVNFPSNLAAIVGPNGCGKSNVIDAVRWVMGESSAKHLRGESMADVIFNGSSGRQAVSQASIELVFDNSDGKLGGEYAAFTDIAIKRKVTLDGLSEYYLNGAKCRRRDITDIFLGTGLGPRSYAIIEQGMITRLIEAKPEELRVFIEEAAGISKYKERRKETESRIRRTRDNLDRLTDLREELERQLSTLQRQAKAAEKYKETKVEERLYKAQLHTLQWQALDKDGQACDTKIRDLEVQLEGVVAEQVALETAQEKSRDEYTQINDELDKVQGSFYSIGAEISKAEQAIRHAEEQRHRLSKDLDQTASNLLQSQNLLSSDSEKIAQWQRELNELGPQLAQAGDAEKVSGAALQAAEEAMNQWQQGWDEFNQESAKPRQQAEVQQSRIEQLERNLQRQKQRSEAIATELQGLHSEEGDDQRKSMAAALEQMEADGETRQQQLQELQAQISAKREAITQLDSELDAARAELQKSLGRQASLEALQQAAMDDGEAGVGQWIRGQALDQQPRLLDKIKVQSGWETAVETVLGEHLQAVCVDAIDRFGDALGVLKKGTLQLFDSAGSQSTGGGQTLASEISAGAELVPQLSAIKTASDLPAALSMRRSLAAHESVITRDGIWVGPNWVRVQRGETAGSGVIARRQELEDLAKQIEQLQRTVDDKGETLTAQRNEVKADEQRRDQIQSEQQKHGRAQGELRSKLSALVARLEQLALRRVKLETERDDLHKQFEDEQQTITACRAELQGALDQMEKDTARREVLLKERESNREQLDAARQKARQDKDLAHQLAMQVQSLQTRHGSVGEQVQRARRQLEQLEGRKAELEQSLQIAKQPAEGLQAELDQKLEARLRVEETLSEVRRRREQVEQAMRQQDSSRHDIDKRLQGVRGLLEQARVDNQGMLVRRQQLEQLIAQSNYEFDQLIAEMPEEASEPAWLEHLELIERRIARLGPINLAAIDEYASASERKQYLDAQNDDLTEALTTLEAAIRRIDRETRHRFKETFDRVNSGLGELFPRVFGGGSASLEMTGDDLLDTGVAIMARPPGKKNSTIHLLSGGEKALTAIALVFSIFQLNPAPFCMLDEVDAPLDDANVGRYARLVQEMSAKLQFIVITHNKIAMEMAEQLIGVTMHEPGVSRLVTVDLEAAAELAEA